MRLAELETPRLVLDAGRMEANVARMKAEARARGVGEPFPGGAEARGAGGRRRVDAGAELQGVGVS